MFDTEVPAGVSATRGLLSRKATAMVRTTRTEIQRVRSAHIPAPPVPRRSRPSPRRVTPTAFKLSLRLGGRPHCPDRWSQTDRLVRTRRAPVCASLRLRRCSSAAAYPAHGARFRQRAERSTVPSVRRTDIPSRAPRGSGIRSSARIVVDVYPDSQPLFHRPKRNPESFDRSRPGYRRDVCMDS